MKIIYIIIGLVLLTGIIFCLLSCKNNLKSNSQIKQQKENKTKIEENKAIKNPYEDLRNMALAMTPEQLGLTLKSDKTIVYGIVMDWKVGEGIATFIVFQTGDASMYSSTGGGVIGGVTNENVKKAAIAFIDKSRTYLSKTIKTETAPLAEENSVKFYFLTNKGKFVAQERMENFENNSSEWLALFEEANKVITQLRLTTPKDENENRR